MASGGVHRALLGCSRQVGAATDHDGRGSARLGASHVALEPTVPKPCEVRCEAGVLTRLPARGERPTDEALRPLLPDRWLAEHPEARLPLSR